MNSTKKKNTLIAITLVVLTAVSTLASSNRTTEASSEAVTYNQKGYALKKYSTKNFKVLKNKNYGATTLKKFKTYEEGATTPHKLKKKKGNKSATFTTSVYLPKSYEASGDMGNPQSICVTPDGQYAYIIYPKKGSKTKGRIIRYDMDALAQLGICKSGSMDDLRAVARKPYYAKKGEPLTERESQILSCMTIGPWFNTGHGCAFAYNPKDGCIWFSSKTGSKNTDLQRINMETLKPDLIINYKMYGTVGMGNNLTFDRKGRFYFFSYSGGGWTPKGTIKIYQGTINLKKTKKVTVNLVMQGIRYRASTGIQSAGYNRSNNRIYLVSNSAIMSFPVDKLGKMKKSDVWTTQFDVNREFEGLAFDQTGKAYLLVNKQPEILTAKPGF